MANKKSKISLVLQAYPNAKAVKVDSYVEIHSGEYVLGQGKNNRCAWEAVYNNWIK